MKNILFLGCSFSALYYHPDPRWSYTYKVMKDLGFDRMINLSVAGASPSTLNRILLSYINNPVYGWPDFVFAQFPYAYRNEYYLDHNEEPHMKDIIAWYEDFDKSCWHQDENVNLKDRIEEQLSRLLPNGDVPNRYVRSASFSFVHYANSDIKKVYISPNIKNHKHAIVGKLFDFLTN